MPEYTVYCIRTGYDAHYTGISRDAEARLREHNSGKCEATRGRVWETAFRLIYENRETAYLVERWLKTGDTRKKRATIELGLKSQPANVVAHWTLDAAKKWQAGIARKNAAGIPERSE